MTPAKLTAMYNYMIMPDGTIGDLEAFNNWDRR